MKKLFVFLFSASLFFVGLGNVSAFSANMSFETSSSTVVGSQIKVLMYITPDNEVTNGLGSIGGFLEFDESLVEFVSATPNNSTGLSFFPNDETNKYAIMDFSGGTNAPKSKTLLYTFTFNVIAAGNATFSYSSLEVTDTVPTTVPTTVSNLNLTLEEPSNNNNLSSLSVTGQSLTPVFNPDVTTYNLTVPYTVSSVNVSAATASSAAKVSGAGNKSLSYGSNTVTIKVTAQNGDEKTYTINITRESDTRSTDNNLKSLTFESFNITPIFSSSTTSYSVVVPYNVTTGDVVATTNNSKASVVISGNTDFEVGTNEITINVTAENGLVKTYTLSVIREEEVVIEKSSDSSLKSLEIENQEINPEFSADNTIYNLNVENDVTSLNVNALANHDKATVSITGNTDLKEGINSIIVKVTSESGSVTSYIINVNRKEKVITTTPVTKSNDSYLKTLEIEGYKIEFDKNLNSYNVTVPFEVSFLDIEYTTNNSKAKASITGNSNFEINAVSSIEIKVTAEDGSLRIYTINVTRSPLSSNNELKEIIINDEALENFDSKVTEYDITVTADTKELVLSASAFNPKADLSYDKITTLENGNNTIIISVVDENGFTKYYRLNVFREESESNFLLYAIAAGITLCFLSIILVLIVVLRKKKSYKKYKDHSVIDFKPEFNFNSNNGNVKSLDNSVDNKLPDVTKDIPYDPYDDIVTKDEIIDAIKNKDVSTLKMLYEQEMLNRTKEKLKEDDKREYED